MIKKWLSAVVGVPCLALCGCGYEPLSPTQAYWHVRLVDTDLDIRKKKSRGSAHYKSQTHSNIASNPLGTPPTFALAATCQSSGSGVVSTNCISDETSAKVRLVKRWKDFSMTAKRNCVELTKSYRPSYVETVTCLELDQKVIESDYASAMKQNSAASDITGTIGRAKK